MKKKNILVDSPITLYLKVLQPNKILSATLNSKEFYKRFLPLHNDCIKINLKQKGNYIFNHFFEILNTTPLQYNKVNFNLPQKERLRNIVNPQIRLNKTLKNTPARIYSKVGLIEISKDFLPLNKQTQLFILLHECGHLFYKTEYKADMFALYFFLKLGHNKSQAYYSLSEILKPTTDNKKRIDKLFELIK